MKIQRRTLFTTAMASLALAGLVVGAAASQASSFENAPAEQPEQKTGNIREAQPHAHPGGGYTFHDSGPCAGSWQSPSDPSACVHADFTDPESSDLSGDSLETFSTAYNNELLGPDYCSGASPGYRFRVLYVTTKDRTNRYTDLKAKLQDKAELADYYLYESARQTSGTRHLRYVCDGTLVVTAVNGEDRIIVDNVVLPNTADDSFDNTLKELRAAGYNNSNRKYMAFLDWKECCNADGTRKNNVGGRGEIKADDKYGQDNLNNNGNMIGTMYLRACTDCEAGIALHEMVHTLGGVQQTSPQHDGKNTWHPRDEYDRLAYGANSYIRCGDSSQEWRLDCAKDDYFHTNPGSTTYLGTKWNVARNRFLVGGG